MFEIAYNVGELRKVIKESSQEFSPVIGKNVERDNKKNNDESYKEIEKQVNTVKVKPTANGMEDDKQLPERHDDNATTLSFNPVLDPPKEYKDKVRAQAKGYTSKDEEDNGIEKADEYDDAGKILNQFDKNRDDIEQKRIEKARAGLVARELPKERFDKNHLDESGKPKPKTFKFKHTTFLNEEQVLNRIPEEYKRDGQVFRMIDASDNEYVVECLYSPKADIMETRIIEHKNKSVMNEQVNRMFELMGYTSPKNLTMSDKTSRDEGFASILNTCREQE